MTPAAKAPPYPQIEAGRIVRKKLMALGHWRIDGRDCDAIARAAIDADPLARACVEAVREQVALDDAMEVPGAKAVDLADAMQRANDATARAIALYRQQEHEMTEWTREKLHELGVAPTRCHNRRIVPGQSPRRRPGDRAQAHPGGRGAG